MMRKVYRIYLIIISLLTLCLVGCQPSASILLSDGRQVSQNDLKTQWKVINVWAEWCKPCWQEIPEVNRFYQQVTTNSARETLDLKAAPAMNVLANVQVFGFNFDKLGAKELQVLKQKMNIKFPVLTQWPETWPQTELKGLPATIFISPDNRIVKVLFGPQDLDSLSRALDNALTRG